MKLIEREELFKEEYIVIKKIPYGVFCDINDLETLDPCSLENKGMKNCDQFTLSDTGFVQGCYSIKEKLSFVKGGEGFTSGDYHNYYSVNLGSHNVLISENDFNFNDEDEFIVIDHPLELKEYIEDEDDYFCEEIVVDESHENLENIKEIYCTIDNNIKEKCRIEEAENKKQLEKINSLFNLYHKDDVMEKSFKLSVYGELFWNYWNSPLNKGSKCEELFREWVNTRNENLTNLSPLEYSYLSNRDEGLTELDTVSKIIRLLSA
jgi:hypothetical protein